MSQPWVPNAATMQQLIGMLIGTYDVKTSNADRVLILQNLEEAKKSPEFICYLAYVFVHLKPPQIPAVVRHSSGILLKNAIKGSFNQIPPAILVQLKQDVLPCIRAAEKNIRKTAGSVVASIVNEGELKNWPELLPVVIPLLSSSNPNECFGAFDVICKLCEDTPEQLDSEDTGRPLNVLVPMFLQFFRHSHAVVRELSLECLNLLIPHQPLAIDVHFDAFLQGISSLAADPSPEVRKRLCSAINRLMDMRLHLLMPHMSSIMQFMFRSTQDKEDVVRLEATEFWTHCCMCGKPVHELLEPMLPQLLPVLMRGMMYQDDDDMLVGAEDEDDKEDKDEDIRPQHFSSEQKGTKKVTFSSDASDDDDDDDDDDEGGLQEGTWTVRKGSAQGLDNIACAYGPKLLQLVLPLLEARLAHKEWRVRESAILALGAVSQGCMEGLEQYLPKLYPFLMILMKDEMPLIRSISCWTFSRYGSWVVHTTEEPTLQRAQYFERLVAALLERICDRNKKVQEAACSAFATLEETAGERMVPYVGHILNCFDGAFQRYQSKNLIILYDTVITLVEAVGDDVLSKDPHACALLKPLFAKWQTTANDHKMMLPLLECFTVVVKCLGVGFQKFAQATFQRCVQIVQLGLANAATCPEDEDFALKEHVFGALDLISGLADGLGNGMANLVNDSNLLNILGSCLKLPALSVRQSALALVGDLAKTAPVYLKPAVPAFLPIVCDHIHPSNVFICNNAAWAIGEIIVGIIASPTLALDAAASAQLTEQRVMHRVLDRLVQVLSTAKVNETLAQNAAITIGRVALVSAQIVSLRLVQLIRPWCVALRDMPDDHEKASAFSGICSVIRGDTRPLLQPPHENLAFFCDAIARWQAPPPALAAEFRDVLTRIKAAMSAQNMWPEFHSKLSKPLQERLSRLYQL